MCSGAILGTVLFLGRNKQIFKEIDLNPRPTTLKMTCATQTTPNIRSIDEMCVRTDRPMIELILGVSGWNTNLIFVS
jgi:hypothetical protein